MFGAVFVEPIGGFLGMTRQELWEKAKLLPLSPGVYLMHGKSGKIIYVGKSRALRNRVSSYFAPSSHHRGKTARMVAAVDDFEVYITGTELEALLQEDRFIKQFSPRYNIKLKDGGGYPYIRMSDSPYPTLSTAWRRSGGGRYFGPYSSAFVAKGIIESANAAFGLPTCGKEFPRDIGKGRPCLNYQIGRCMGVCRKGAVSEKDYAETVASVTHFLRGDFAFLTRELEERMQKASDHLNFELAARYRDMIKAVKKLGDRQQIVAETSLDCDAVGYFADDLGAEVTMLFIRHGAIVDRQNFEFGADEIIDEQALTGLLAQFYTRRGSAPQNILLCFSPTDEDRALLCECLQPIAEGSLNIATPQRGIKKSLVEMAERNARELLLHSRAVEAKRTGALTEVAEFLHLDTVPDRIESYDISNSGSELASCGMIVMEKGRFAKRKYRSFNISGEINDDCSMLREALGRRFDHSDDENGWEYPDLILMDGAEQQVLVCREILAERGIDIPVYGMIKDEHHKTRTLTDGTGEIGLIRRQDLFVFFYKIQEEVHRYALERMDARRRKKVKQSSLTSVKGVGEAKANALLLHFGTLEALRSADAEAIAQVKGINPETANAIYGFLHSAKEEI